MTTPAAFAEIAARVRNWGRWGEHDELGTLNLIDAEARRRGVAAVRSGEAFCLGLALDDARGIQAGFVPGRLNPLRTMTHLRTPLSDDPDWICSNEDVVVLGTQAATHWDALAHVSYEGLLYNGVPDTTVTAAGATKLGIDKAGAVVSRGVLLDVARAKGVDVLEPGYPVRAADLDAACALGSVTVEPGDIVLVRTGQMVHLALPGRRGRDGERLRRDLTAYTWPAPGLTMETAGWLHEHDVAAVATDTLSLEVFPCEDPAIYLPVHLLHIVEMGLTQGQNFVLDALADACAADGRCTFLLDATPLPFVNGTASPLNPVALR